MSSTRSRPTLRPTTRKDSNGSLDVQGARDQRGVADQSDRS